MEDFSQKPDFSQKQIEVIKFRNKHDPKIIILEGAIRSGKTYLALMLWHRHMIEFAGRNKSHIITGYTIGSIQRNLLDPIQEMFGIDTTLDKFNSFRVYGNKVTCFGTEKENSYKAMRGQTAYSWLSNEATLHHQNSITEAFERCSGIGARIIMDTNPSWPQHPIKINYIDHSGEMLDSGRMKLKSWHFILDDNNQFLPADYIQLIKETTPAGYKYDRDILGRWVTASGVVYPEWNEGINVIKKLAGKMEGWRRYGGIDFGFTNPFVYLLTCTDPDGRLYIVDEHYKSRMLIKDHAEIIKKMNGKNDVSIVADHDAQEMAELRDQGIKTKRAQKAVMAGIQAVSARLKVQPDGRPRLYVLENCKNTIREMGCYSWKDQKDGVNAAEEPLKKDDHCPDDIRYIVMQVDNRKAVIG